MTAHVGDPDAAVLINTAELANYVVEPADTLSAVTVQTSLFLGRRVQNSLRELVQGNLIACLVLIARGAVSSPVYS